MGILSKRNYNPQYCSILIVKNNLNFDLLRFFSDCVFKKFSPKFFKFAETIKKLTENRNIFPNDL